MRFGDVLHQRAAVDRVQRALRSGRVPHAYLFSGPDGVGKEMLATRLAAVLLCGNPETAPVSAIEDALAERGEAAGAPASRRWITGGTPVPQYPQTVRVPATENAPTQTWSEACGRCDDCVLLAAGNHPDFHRIYRQLTKVHPDSAVQKRKAVELSVDVIRHFLIEKVGLHPARGRAKVFVIVDAHRLSPSAQNAMLKTLEEPPGSSYIILLTTSADALLPTTRSRCQQIAFSPLPAAFIAGQLAECFQFAPAASRFIAELAQGSLGMARFYAEIGLLERLPVVLGSLDAASSNWLQAGKVLLDLAKELNAAMKNEDLDDLGEDTNTAREAQLAVLAMVGTVLRDVHRVVVGHEPAALPQEPAIGALAGRASSDSLRRMIRAVGNAEYQIRHSANTTLIFDVLGIELGRGFAEAAARPAR